jgi:PAS domain S-box-containing protein
MVHTPSPDRAESADDQASPGELRHAIERMMGQQLYPIGVGVAAIYTISAVMQIVGSGLASRGSQAAAAAIVALLGITIAVGARKQWFASRWSHHLGFALGVASLGEATWCILVSPKPSESLYIALVILGCGMLLLAPLSWAVLVSAATAVWICVSVLLTPELNWQEYQFVIIATIMLSGVSMAMRLKVIERLETERISRAHHARQLQASEQRQSIILDMLPMAMYTVRLVDGKMRTTWVSDKIVRLTGFEPQQFLGDSQLWNRNIHPDEKPLTLRQSRAIDAEGQAAEEFRWRCADGEYRWFLDHAVATYDNQGRKSGLIGVWLDIDERKRVVWEKSRLELELRQAQKLEAVGTLASGIAHDFNNLLTAINGFAKVARESLDQTHPTQEHIARIEEAADRARHVTRSLLTFAHHAPSQKRPIRLAALIEDTTPLLRRLLSRNVRIDTAVVDSRRRHADPARAGQPCDQRRRRNGRMRRDGTPHIAARSQ